METQRNCCFTFNLHDAVLISGLVKNHGVSMALGSLQYGNSSQNTPPLQFDISSACGAFDCVSDIELSFLIPSTSSVDLDPGDWGEKTTDYLARRVARTPADLRNHVQRINLHIKLQDKEGTYSALLDLFIAVGKNGKTLKTRMLGRSKALLSKHRYDAMKRKLKQGINGLTVMPLASYSVLGMGLTGTTRLTEHLL